MESKNRPIDWVLKLVFDFIFQEAQTLGSPDFRKPRLQEAQNSGNPDFRKPRLRNPRLQEAQTS